MAVGPLVYWWGGTGSAPPVVASDKFTPKFLIGNAPAGDGTSPSVAGFNYILDPGDGSGILLAVAAITSGDIHIRQGTYAFPVGTTLNVPANVKISGAGRGNTLISNANFVLAAGASLADLSSAAPPGFAAVSASAAKGLLRDVSLFSTTVGISVGGTGVFSIENVDVTISTQVGPAILAGGAVEVVCQNLRTTGSLTSVDVQGAVFKCDNGSFVGASKAFNNKNGRVSFSNTTFQAVGGTVMTFGDITDSFFENCFVTGTNCMDFSSSNTCDGLTFDSCEFTGTTTCVTNLSPGGTARNVHFRDCRMTAGAITLSVPKDVFNFSILDTTVTSTGATAVFLNTEAFIRGSTFVSTGGAALVTIHPDCRVSDTVLRGLASTPALEVLSGNSSFSSVFVYGGGVHLGLNVDGCSFVNSRVDITAAAPVPLAAILVEGSGNTFGLITYTPAATPSVHFTAASANNIVLSVVGFGANPTVVSDLGTNNEVAHNIGI